MANLQDIYVKIGVSGKPTEMDKVGCDGLFIESTEICTKEIAQLKAENEALRELPKVLDRLADWIEKINDDPFGAITEGYPSSEKMVLYLRQRMWETAIDTLLTE